jgi:hypothetical protein
MDYHIFGGLASARLKRTLTAYSGVGEQERRTSEPNRLATEARVKEVRPSFLDSEYCESQQNA